MFGIGHWEILFICGCIAVPVVIGAIVALVLVLTNSARNPPDDRRD